MNYLTLNANWSLTKKYFVVGGVSAGLIMRQFVKASDSFGDLMTFSIGNTMLICDLFISSFDLMNEGPFSSAHYLLRMKREIKWSWNKILLFFILN